MTRPLKVFAPCGYTWSNKGDATLLLAMGEAFQARFPGAEVTFTSFTPEEDASRYGHKVIPMPINPDGLVSKATHGVIAKSPLRGLVPYATAAQVVLFLALMRVWTWLWRLAPRGAMRLLPSRTAAVVRESLESDLIVGVPGGYLMAPAAKDDYWLYHVALLGVPLLLKRPVGLYSCSLGPFVGLHRPFAKWLLNRVDLIVLREGQSAKHLEGLLRDGSRVARAPDAAFAFEHGADPADLPADILARLDGRPRPWVGFSVRHYHFPGRADPEALFERYLAEVSRCAAFVHDRGGTAVFVPQSIDAAGRDVEVARLVQARLAGSASAVLVDADLSPQQLQALYGRLDVMVGTRMHANILALSRRVPTIAVAYEHKTVGIMETVGLERWVLDMGEVEGRLLPLLGEMLSERASVAAHLEQVIPRLQREALAVPTLLAERLGATQGGAA
jgi:colanic acid/amylovoran biosynthesis protein